MDVGCLLLHLRRQGCAEIQPNGARQIAEDTPQGGGGASVNDRLLPLIFAATFQTLEDKYDFAIGKQAALRDLFRTLLHELMTPKTRVHELELPDTAN